jgi:hypothetical protein
LSLLVSAKFTGSIREQSGIEVYELHFNRYMAGTEFLPVASASTLKTLRITLSHQRRLFEYYSQVVKDFRQFRSLEKVDFELMDEYIDQNFMFALTAIPP